MQLGVFAKTFPRPVPAGAGMLPWDVIIDALDGAGFGGTLVIHGLAEPDVGLAVRTLQGAMAREQCS